MEDYDIYLSDSLKNLRSTLNDSGTRPILFVGSGISQRYLGAPNWEGLLELLIEQNVNIRHPIGYFKQNSSDLPEIASHLVDLYKDYAWDNFDENIFPHELYNTSDKSLFLKYQISMIFKSFMESFNASENEYSLEIELLKKLQPHAIITTNYDKLIEELFPEHQVIVGQQVIKSKNSNNIGRILKIHGCVDKRNEIVISKEDYQMFRDKQKYLTAKILTYFMEHPVIFMGYSVSDENIKEILSDIVEIVTESPDEIVDNIWFIDWSGESIHGNERPPQDKNIPLGEGKNIRVNYIKLHNFDPLYESLYQDDVSSIDALMNLEDMVYNIVKSKSISELAVDFVTMRSIQNENNLAEKIGFQKTNLEINDNDNAVTVLGFGTIADPETVMLRYPYRLSDIAKELSYEHFNYANMLIKKLEKETGFDIKESNNRYHFELKHGSSTLRLYSSETVDLLRRFKEDEYYKILDDDGQVINELQVN